MFRRSLCHTIRPLGQSSRHRKRLFIALTWFIDYALPNNFQRGCQKHEIIFQRRLGRRLLFKSKNQNYRASDRRSGTFPLDLFDSRASCVISPRWNTGDV